MAMHIKQISETNSEYLVPNEEEKSKPSNKVATFNFEPSEEDKNMGLSVEPENKPGKLIRNLVKPKKELMDKENEAYKNINDAMYGFFSKYLNTEHLGGVSNLMKNDTSLKDLTDKFLNYLHEHSILVSESMNKSLPELTREFINKYFGNKESK